MTATVPRSLDSPEIRTLAHQLNHMLGRELGRRADGHSIFAWKWSEDLFWPTTKTGRTVTRDRQVEIPIIGGLPTSALISEITPEYVQSRQVQRRNTWYMTKWLNAEELIWGWIGRHGGEIQGPSSTARPSQEQLEKLWESHFPGAEFPHNGWRIPTDAWLPRSEHDSPTPTEADTRYFVACVKEQTRLTFDQRLADMLLSEDRIQAEKDRVIADEVREAFPAFLNPTPGKRNNFISFPFTKKDFMR